MKPLAVITGGSGFLGSAIAEKLGNAGYAIALFDQNEESLNQVSKKLSLTGISCFPKMVDILDNKELSRASRELNTEVGPAEILVTCLGYSPKRDGEQPGVFEISDTEWQSVIDINLTSVFNSIKAFLPQMKSQGGGRIVTLASTAGLVGSSTAGIHYCAAKAGVVGLTRALTNECANYNVLINSVAPGKVANSNWGDSDEAIAEYIQAIPLNRLADPKDICEIVLFLVSESNHYITGKVITVDGGRTSF